MQAKKVRQRDRQTMSRAARRIGGDIVGRMRVTTMPQSVNGSEPADPKAHIEKAVYSFRA